MEAAPAPIVEEDIPPYSAPQDEAKQSSRTVDACSFLPCAAVPGYSDIASPTPAPISAKANGEFRR